MLWWCVVTLAILRLCDPGPPTLWPSTAHNSMNVKTQCQISVCLQWNETSSVWVAAGSWVKCSCAVRVRLCLHFGKKTKTLLVVRQWDYLFRQLIEQIPGLLSLSINLLIIISIHLYKIERNAHLNFSGPKVTSTNCLFCQTNSVTPTDSWFYNYIKRGEAANCHIQEAGTSNCSSFFSTTIADL